MNCPSCSKKLSALHLSDHYDRPVEIDACFDCRIFWFDHFEQVRIHSKWVRNILQKIAENSSITPKEISGKISCPRCENILQKKYDFTSTGEKIQEFSCQKHGNLLSFDDFFHLKNLYSGFSVDDQQKPLFVQCKNCGHDIDPTSQKNCQYCDTPFSFFDANILQQILGEKALKKPEKDTVGTHYLANFYQCDISQLAKNSEIFEQKMKEISQKISAEGLSVLDHKFHYFGENAITGFFLLAESHIAFHTWPEKNFVSCDVFVCHHTCNNETPAENILKYLEKTVFQSAETEIQKILR